MTEMNQTIRRILSAAETKTKQGETAIVSFSYSYVLPVRSDIDSIFQVVG